MIGSLQTGVSGLQQFQEDLEVIGNNIANVNTTGYKSNTMQFAVHVQPIVQRYHGGGASRQVGTGVTSSSIDSDFTQGAIADSGSKTNLAVSGDGFFVVKDPTSSVSYVTRDGTFKTRNAPNGFLVTSTGNRVQGYTGTAPFSSASTIGDLQINAATAITSLGDTTTPAPTLSGYSIDATGQINATLSDGTSGVIGQVVLQNFSNPQALLKQGDNLFTFDANAGPMAAAAAPNTAAALGTIRAGALESSNVDLAGQMAAMITAQRAFEANAKIVTTSDEVLQDLINLKR